MNTVSRIGQGALVAIAVYCALMIDLRAIVPGAVVNGHYVGDFTVFWTAATADRSVVYDVQAISDAQAPLTGGDVGPRPFVNPPSFLLWLAPFGRLPFFPAMILWTVLGLLAFGWSCRGLVQWHHAALIIVSPPFVLALVAGQVTFFVVAATVGAILHVRTRPVMAGLLLGLAATIKPQSVLLAPLALAAGAHWRALLAALVGGALIGGVCVLLQGSQLWLNWWQSLEAFIEIAKVHYLINRGATPTSLAYRLGLEGNSAQLLIWSLAVLGLGLVLMVFRNSTNPGDRIAALTAGNLLCVPYAMPYDMTPLLIPAAIWLLGKDRRWWLPGFLTISQLFLPLGVIVMGAGAFIRSGAWRHFTPSPSWGGKTPQASGGGGETAPPAGLRPPPSP